ncbi:helicase-related protein [Archangium gephyra]|uniref:helicase-related protein n=1 Tax=Archangium gephyra TaxID=48 RepID=UPI003B7B1E10
MEKADGFFMEIREYQQAYERLQKAWSSLDVASAQEFNELYARNPKLDEPLEDAALQTVVDHLREVRNLKHTKIEPGFRRWMIRSLKEQKRVYRKHSRHQLQPSGQQALPFLIYERLIAELFRRHQGTHKAAVQINMVSSYGAARNGELLDSEVRDFPEEAEAYRRLLRGILQDLDPEAAQHPKVDFVLRDALAAAERNEKTLIFCARTATLAELARRLTALWEERMLEKWRRVYPEAAREDIFDTTHDDKRMRARHSLLQNRFRRPQDVLSLALRERYLGSLLPIASFALERLGEVVSRANEKLLQVKVGRTSATDRDYRLLKRCVEQAAAELWRNEHPGDVTYREAVKALCDPRFLSFGLDLAPDDLENDDTGTFAPKWRITEQSARLAIPNGPTLWTELSPFLEQLPFPLRVGIVERLASYLTYKDVPFLTDVVLAARDSGMDPNDLESQVLLPFVDGFWTSALGEPWLTRLRSFLDYFIKRNEQQKQDILDGPLKTGQLVRETRDGESRERLREAFNTPLYPMVLVANEVMQEGLDLHKNCRRVVHHDLAWNPAQLEQRVGRVDRIGSLTLEMRKSDPTAELHVLYPLIQNTIDVRLFRTVKEREKWLEFLLGAPPNFSEYAEAHEEAPDLPPALAQSLAINLQPPRR